MPPERGLRRSFGAEGWSRRALARVSAAPGSGTEGETTAAYTNSISELTWAELSARLQEGISARVATPWGAARFQIPASNATATCVALSGCTAPFINAQSEATWSSLLDARDTNVIVNDCSADWEAFLRTGVNFLRENSDLWLWALCLLFGDDRWPRNRADGQLILDMLETGDIRMNCNDGSELNWCYDPRVDQRDEPLGGEAASEETFELGRELVPGADMDHAEEGVGELSAVILHELAHAAWYVDDAPDSQGYFQAFALDNTFVWACLQRYPDAAGVGCVSNMAANGVPLASLFLNDTSGTQIDLTGCSACATQESTTLDLYCAKHPEECTDRASVEDRDVLAH